MFIEVRRAGQVSSHQGEASPGLFGDQLRIVPRCQSVWTILLLARMEPEVFLPLSACGLTFGRVFKFSHTVNTVPVLPGNFLLTRPRNT